MKRRLVPFSAQQIDPLTWFTGPYVPISFGALTIIAGVLATAAGWSDLRTPALQIVAVALCTSSHLIIHFAARGLRGVVDVRIGVLAVAVSAVGMLCSAIGYFGVPLHVELWWAPFAVALTIGSLGPYLPAAAIALIGSIATIVITPISTVLVRADDSVWGFPALLVIVGSPLAAAALLTTVFSMHVVGNMQRLLENRSQNIVAGERPDGRAEENERIRLAQLTATAVPFLESMERRGVVEPVDRALAGQLARQLRDDLVTQANSSWLRDDDDGSRLVVIDPDGRADRLRPSQRTALRGFIRALLSTPGVDQNSLLVELRGRPDGATAVGVSMEAMLPDGRRTVHLAPYYLTLRMAADDLVWRNDDLFRVTFAFSPEDD